MKMMEESTYWEGKAPPSVVLGPFLSKIPSGVLGPASLVALIVVRFFKYQICEKKEGGGRERARNRGRCMNGKEKKTGRTLSCLYI